ncbi:MAG: enoyl-CoA hydratase [Enterovirga sp.]|nr:enoyl-CoA hydratase [Enterovirga sp.]
MITLSQAGRVATLTLDRPPVNAMSDGWVAAFGSVLNELEARDDWTVLLIRSALKVFCAGADLKQIRDDFAKTPEEQAETGRRYQSLFARIETLPGTVLCEIGGAALGGGLELALACDLRVGAREAKLGLPEVGLGLIPGAGGTQRLTRLLGPAVAARLILGAEVIDGAEAHRLGLLDWVCDRGSLAETASAIARQRAALPRHAVAAAKLCIAAALDPAADGFSEETRQVRGLLASDATRSLVQAFLGTQAT